MNNNKMEKYLEPKKNIDSVIIPKNVGNSNGNYDFKISNLKQIQKYHLENKVVTTEDMTDSFGHRMDITLEHTFGDDYSTIKMLGEKPIIWEHNKTNTTTLVENNLSDYSLLIIPFCIGLVILSFLFRKKLFRIN